MARWLGGLRGPLRLEDGRPLNVVFPGIPGPGPGPDVRDAILDAGGDYLRGDVEFHLLASGWESHGHAGDPAYGRVVLHVVAHNDRSGVVTNGPAGRRIPIFVLPPAQAPLPGEAFTPPCAFEAARGRDLAPAFALLARRRFRAKSAAAALRVAHEGVAQSLYGLLLETLGGSANRAAFAQLATKLPLAALLDASARPSADERFRALCAHLRYGAAEVSFLRAGQRPSARPERRIEAAAALVARLWPSSVVELPQVAPSRRPVLKALGAAGVGRSLAVELAVNSLAPVMAAAGAWSEDAALGLVTSLPSPGTYGLLRPLESWLQRPFTSAADLQAGLLLHRDYCSRGLCGRCPLSS